MLRYHVAFYLPNATGEMVVAEALDFPGAVTQGFDLPDARLMIASAMEDLAQSFLEEGSLCRYRIPEQRLRTPTWSSWFRYPSPSARPGCEEARAGQSPPAGGMPRGAKSSVPRHDQTPVSI